MKKTTIIFWVVFCVSMTVAITSIILSFINTSDFLLKVKNILNISIPFFLVALCIMRLVEVKYFKK